MKPPPLTGNLHAAEIERLQLWYLLADRINDIEWELLAVADVQRLQWEVEQILG